MHHHPLRAVLCAALLVALVPARTALASPPDAAPLPLRLATAGGGAVDLGALRGRVVVLNFWAPFCGACLAEAPTLQRAYERLRARGGTLVGVTAMTDSLDEAASAARAAGMRYPIALADRDVMRAFGGPAVPRTVVLGRDGRVVRSFVGVVTAAQLDRAVAEAWQR